MQLKDFRFAYQNIMIYLNVTFFSIFKSSAMYLPYLPYSDRLYNTFANLMIFCLQY